MTETSLPLIEWPTSTLKCKVVQLFVQGQAGLATGRVDLKHRTVLAAYLIERGIGYDYMRDYDDQNAPELNGRGYRVVGAGLGHFDTRRRFVKFGGDSSGYGIPISPEHVEELKRAYPGWTFGSVTPQSI